MESAIRSSHVPAKWSKVLYIMLTVSGFAINTVLEMPSVQYRITDFVEEEEEKALGKMFVTKTYVVAC